MGEANINKFIKGEFRWKKIEEKELEGIEGMKNPFLDKQNRREGIWRIG